MMMTLQSPCVGSQMGSTPLFSICPSNAAFCQQKTLLTVWNSRIQPEYPIMIPLNAGSYVIPYLMITNTHVFVLFGRADLPRRSPGESKVRFFYEVVAPLPSRTDRILLVSSTRS